MLKPFRRIDIEFHSKCNRKCDWCPNKRIDRVSNDYIMDKDLYIKILKDIRDNNYKENVNSKLDLNKVISFMGFEEPFLQPDIFKEYLDIAYKILGDTIFFEAHSNGDFLTKENLQNLHLNKLSIMDYDCKGKDYWMQKMKELDCVFIYPETDKEFLSFIHESINLIQIHLNWPEKALLENRGGFLTKEELQGYNLKNNMNERHFECPEMSYFISISYNGLIMPCCHMRFDNPMHKDYIIGDLKTQTLSEIFQSEKYNKLKNILQ